MGVCESLSGDNTGETETLRKEQTASPARMNEEKSVGLSPHYITDSVVNQTREGESRKKKEQTIRN